MTDTTHAAERPVEWHVVEAWTTGNGLMQLRLVDDDVKTYLIAALVYLAICFSLSYAVRRLQQKIQIIR